MSAAPSFLRAWRSGHGAPARGLFSRQRRATQLRFALVDVRLRGFLRGSTRTLPLPSRAPRQINSSSLWSDLRVETFTSSSETPPGRGQVSYVSLWSDLRLQGFHEARLERSLTRAPWRINPRFALVGPTGCQRSRDSVKTRACHAKSITFRSGWVFAARFLRGSTGTLPPARPGRSIHVPLWSDPEVESVRETRSKRPHAKPNQLSFALVGPRVARVSRGSTGTLPLPRAGEGRGEGAPTCRCAFLFFAGQRRCDAKGFCSLSP